MRLLFLYLVSFLALFGQQPLQIDAVFGKDNQRDAAKIGSDWVFRCDGEKLTVADTSTLPHPSLEVTLRNQGRTFEVTFAVDGTYTAAVNGQQCLTGNMTQIALAPSDQWLAWYPDNSKVLTTPEGAIRWITWGDWELLAGRMPAFLPDDRLELAAIP